MRKEIESQLDSRKFTNLSHLPACLMFACCVPKTRLIFYMLVLVFHFLCSLCQLTPLDPCISTRPLTSFNLDRFVGKFTDNYFRTSTTLQTFLFKICWPLAFKLHTSFHIYCFLGEHPGLGKAFINFGSSFHTKQLLPLHRCCGSKSH